MTWTELTAVARRQRGVVSVRQADGLGIARSTLLDHAARHDLRRPARGVVLFEGADPADDRTRCWIALCDVGAPAWVGGATSLALHDVGRPPANVVLVVPRARRPRARSGATVLRADLEPTDLTRRRGVPTVGVAVSLRQLAAVETHREVLATVAAAVQQRRTTLDEVATAAAGRTRGSRRLRTAVSQLQDSGAHSILAHEVTVLLRQAGYRVEAEVRVRRSDGRSAVVDLRILGTHVVVEADGAVAHASARQQSADRHRRNGLVASGLRVLRIDWQRLLGDPDGFLEEVRLTVARSGRARVTR